MAHLPGSRIKGYDASTPDRWGWAGVVVAAAIIVGPFIPSLWESLKVIWNS